jgi:Leucine-rich repeat (LRR) protein
MNKISLYNQLCAAYSAENLNKITARIIEAYRKKEHRYLQELYDRVDTSLSLNEQATAQIFSRLVLLYHPDQLPYYQNELAQCRENHQDQRLNKHAHILDTLANLKRRINKAPDDFMESYMEDTGYGFDEEDFDHVMRGDEFEDDWSDYNPDHNDEDDRFQSNDFLSALQRAEYAHTGVRITASDLVNFQGFLNLAESDIDDLAGVEKCRNITALDISGNQLEDVAPLGFLTGLEELYMGNNSVTDIRPLAKMQRLKNLDLSFNGIRDFKVLLNLSGLKYVNLIGNKAPAKQIEALQKRGILVVL